MLWRVWPRRSRSNRIRISLLIDFNSKFSNCWFLCGFWKIRIKPGFLISYHGRQLDVF
jgi:hypothetical protein